MSIIVYCCTKKNTLSGVDGETTACFGSTVKKRRLECVWSDDWSLTTVSAAVMDGICLPPWPFIPIRSCISLYTFLPSHSFLLHPLNPWRFVWTFFFPVKTSYNPFNFNFCLDLSSSRTISSLKKIFLFFK